MTPIHNLEHIPRHRRSRQVPKHARIAHLPQPAMHFEPHPQPLLGQDARHPAQRHLAHGPVELAGVARRAGRGERHAARVEPDDVVVPHPGDVQQALHGRPQRQRHRGPRAARPAGVDEDGAGVGRVGDGDGGGEGDDGDGGEGAFRVRRRGRVGGGLGPVQGHAQARALEVAVAGVVLQVGRGRDGGPVEGGGVELAGMEWDVEGVGG